MKKKGRRRHHHHYTGGDGKAEIPVLAERLAPQEEREAKVPNALPMPDDTIIVDSSKLQSPRTIMEHEQEKRGWLGLEPVVFVLLIVMLAFIAYITYQVSLMPAPVK